MQGRALLITLYYTGARPNEVLRLRKKDISKRDTETRINKEGQPYEVKSPSVVLMLPGSKKGVTRSLSLDFKEPLIRELFEYTTGILGDDTFLFSQFQSTRQHVVPVMQKVIEAREDGSHVTRYIKVGIRKRLVISDNLYYHVKKWFKGVFEDSIPPYYLRHNRFTKMAEKGALPEDIRLAKGARSIRSVEPYLHMSPRTLQKLKKLMND